ncbi:MAG: PVC-type heme-binding CxxCH protein [Verrucomicrobiales bacterium]
MSLCRFHLLCASVLIAIRSTALFAAPVPLFDGKSLDGWEGDTEETWRVIEGVIVGGSLDGNPQNEFLATQESFKNFHLKLEYKLVGSEGFVNGGVQFRSKRIAEPANEMSGYQADIGAGYSGFLYDESRRRKFLAEADPDLIQQLEKLGDWNRYEVIARGREVSIFLNGQRTVTWIEREPEIDDHGKVALQIHGSCKAEISFREITIEELPDPNVPPEGAALHRFGRGQPVVPYPPFADGTFSLREDEVVALVGQENLVREQKAGHLEAVLSRGFASQRPRFRPMAWEADTVYQQWRDLNFGSWSRQLETAGVGVVIAQFGQMEALDGPARLPEFRAAYHRLLDQFGTRTRRLVLVSPMPFERPLATHAPDLTLRNDDVALYAEAIREIASQRGAVYVDLISPLSLRSSADRLTDDGIHLGEAGLSVIAELIAAELGIKARGAGLQSLREAVVTKNQLWFDCWRPANWSFVYGDRVNQKFGKAGGSEPDLKSAFERQLPLVEAADRHIHALALGEDSAPLSIPARQGVGGDSPAALTPDEQLATFTMAPGFAANLFASEEDGVVNPTQFSWDEAGRLYVACSPSYPQSLASAEPSDYILVCEDTDGDGRADKSWKFAENLTMVQGVEPGAGGVYVCDFDRLLHLRDTDGDGRADERRVIFSGFGVGDTHQLVNSVCHGPDGSLWLSQGLHAMSRVETPWGVARLDRAAIWRLRPRSMRLEGFFGGGMAGANCWGVAFDDYGQVFHKSGDRPHGYWSVPGLVRGASPSGSGSDTEASASYRDSPEQYHSVGPLFDTSPKTTSLDIIGTRALPDEIQGCALIGGYFGSVVELHRFEDAGSGFKTSQLPKLMSASNKAFRPVDIGIGPDGSMYVADWYNPIIGHYQASYADPRRDKGHGRIWRISAKGFDPIVQPDLAAMRPAELLQQLGSPERWTRYQAKRLLFDAPSSSVLAAADAMLPQIGDEQLMLEIAGVYEAHESPRPELLAKLLTAGDPRVRAYGARTVGMWAEQLADPLRQLRVCVADENPRVRLESVVAASYIPSPKSIEVVAAALDRPLDPFLDYAIRLSARALQDRWAGALEAGQLDLGSAVQQDYLRGLLAERPKTPSPGEMVYEMACLTCHQPEGRGLPGVYPPLAGSEWVRDGDDSSLIKIVLHGLRGPITVAGEPYGHLPQSVPMPPMGGLTDQQIADVLTLIRTTYGPGGSEVSPSDVKAVRTANSGRDSPWTADELEEGTDG